LNPATGEPAYPTIGLNVLCASSTTKPRFAYRSNLPFLQKDDYLVNSQFSRHKSFKQLHFVACWSQFSIPANVQGSRQQTLTTMPSKKKIFGTHGDRLYILNYLSANLTK
jgi:hypothetical protein